MHLLQVAIALFVCGVLTAESQAPAPDVLDVFPPLHGEALAYDEARDRLIDFGGERRLEGLGDLWSFERGVWRRLAKP